ncbi:MAG: hypothetical protein ACOC8L_15310 [Spirochaetota bacterium]
MTRPPFCPNKECECHIDPHSPQADTLSTRRWYKRNGSYPTLVRGDVIRFKCRVCGCGFSEQTFSLDYFVKRIIDYPTVQMHVCSCSGIRAAARALGCSCDSVSNRISRLARQCISAHSRLVAETELDEDQAADGFQSFAVSQYFPNNIHLLVGSASQLVSFCDYVPLRRSGRMTPTQSRMRAALDELYRAPAQALTDSFSGLLDHLHRRHASSAHRPLLLDTDCKLEYVTALSAHRGLTEATKRGEFSHRRTESRAIRDRRNPLFPVNYIDRELRKDLAEHVRETVRFARNVNHSMERLWTHLFAHNVYKRFRINDPVAVERTHAEEAGASEAILSKATQSLYTVRRFLSFETLEPAAERVWRREHRTPLKGIVKGALRLIRKQASKGDVDLEWVREKLEVEQLMRDVRQYLPRYALA